MVWCVCVAYWCYMFEYKAAQVVDLYLLIFLYLILFLTIKTGLSVCVCVCVCVCVVLWCVCVCVCVRVHVRTSVFLWCVGKGVWSVLLCFSGVCVECV